jgi:tetratricopeptide (TPR) repeat protein
LKTFHRLLAACLIVASVDPLLAQDLESMSRGDDAYARRAEGHVGAIAQPEPIAEAIAAYQQLLDQDPANLAARWKLLKSLYFRGEYVLQDPDERLALYKEARDVADEGRRQLARGAGLGDDPDSMKTAALVEALADNPDAAPIYFWSAVHWGLWGRYRGKMAAAREGVAKRIRDYSEVVIELDEGLEDAGGHRVLGRLHSEAPKLPFFTGWIDRKQAVSELRRAIELAPKGLLSYLYLAEALLEHFPQQKPEAIEILNDLVERQPDPAWVVEDTQILEDARGLLASIGD